MILAVLPGMGVSSNGDNNIMKFTLCPECVNDFIVKPNCGPTELGDEVFALHEQPNIVFGPAECNHKIENTLKELAKARFLTEAEYQARLRDEAK